MLERLRALLTEDEEAILLEETLWVEPAVPLLDGSVASLPMLDEEEDKPEPRRLELLDGSEDDVVDVEAE